MYVDFATMLPLIVAVVLGCFVGVERELTGKPAGIRTHALVCMGAALVVLLSGLLVGDPSAPGRVMQGVITGIGFLGAGVILHARDDHVIGLTTAADLWVVACIGVAAGLQEYFLAVFATVLVLIVLYLGHILRRHREQYVKNPQAKSS
jgi:putative Mg2+ transporter-C (MgtC) family protein